MRRAHRRKLKEHDAGRNRHNKGIAYMDKLDRAHVERSSQRSKKRGGSTPPGVNDALELPSGGLAEENQHG